MMFNQQELLERLENMPIDQIEAIVQRALDEAEVAYTHEAGGIIFSGLIDDEFCLDNKIAAFKYQEDNTCKRQRYANFKVSSTSAYSYYGEDDNLLDAA